MFNRKTTIPYMKTRQTTCKPTFRKHEKRVSDDTSTHDTDRKLKIRKDIYQARNFKYTISYL